MARVPVVRERSVRQAGIQAQPLSPNIPQGAAGIDLTGAANELSDWALRQQDQANQVATMEADSALQQWENEYLYNPETGAMNRQGRNAFGLPEESHEAFEQQRQAIRQGLANDRQRQAFDRIAASRETAIQSLINRHVSSQTQAYAREQTNSYVQRSRETAALNYNDPVRVQMEISRQLAAIDAQAEREGVSDEARAIARDNARSKTLRAALERAIVDDPDTAMARFHEVEDQLSIEDRQQLQPEIQKLQAKAISSSLMGAITGVGAPGNETIWQRQIQAESGGRQFDDDGNPLTSPKGAVGIAQIMPTTGPEAAQLAGLPWNEERFRNDAAYNEALGRAYYEKQLEDFGMPILATAAYNAGPGQLQEWLSSIGDPRTGQVSPAEFVRRIPFKETRDYVRKVVGEANYGAVAGEFGMREALATLREVEDADVRRLALADFSRANSEFNQLRAVEQAELDSRVQDATAAYLQGLDYDQPPVLADFFQAYGGEGGRRYEEFREIQVLGDALRSMALADPEQRIQTLAAFRPDSEGMAGEGFATASRMFGTLVNAAQDMEEQLQDNPVRYITQHSPEMRALLEATESGERTAIDAYASSILEEQERLGVERPRLLSSDQASRIVSGFGRTEDGGDNAARLIASLENQWGKHWPTVFRQLQPDLPGAALVIGTGVDDATANRLARIADIKTGDLKLGLDSLDVRDVQDRLNDEMADFRVTLVNQAGGERTFTTFYQEAERLAYSYMAERVSPRDAANKAFGALVDDRYTIRDTYRVPKPLDAGLIERGANAELENLDVESLSFERADWMDEGFATDQVRNVLRENGYWVTAPDESGLVLYVNGEAVIDRDGEFIARTWDQLAAEAANHPGMWQRFQEGRRSLRGVQRETAPQSWGAVE